MQNAEAAGGGPVGMAALLVRLQRGQIGIPELSAVACEHMIPPPLKDSEYQSLVAVWGDEALDLPPNLVKGLVTAAILGPRIWDHETMGPPLRHFVARLSGGMFGQLAEEPEPENLARPAQPPAPKPEPEPTPPTNGAAPPEPPDAPAAPDSAWQV